MSLASSEGGFKFSSQACCVDLGGSPDPDKIDQIFWTSAELLLPAITPCVRVNFFSDLNFGRNYRYIQGRKACKAEEVRGHQLRRPTRINLKSYVDCSFVEQNGADMRPNVIADGGFWRFRIWCIRPSDLEDEVITKLCCFGTQEIIGDLS